MMFALGVLTGIIPFIVFISVKSFNGDFTSQKLLKNKKESHKEIAQKHTIAKMFAEYHDYKSKFLIAQTDQISTMANPPLLDLNNFHVENMIETLENMGKLEELYENNKVGNIDSLITRLILDIELLKISWTDLTNGKKPLLTKANLEAYTISQKSIHE